MHVKNGYGFTLLKYCRKTFGDADVQYFTLSEQAWAKQGVKLQLVEHEKDADVIVQLACKNTLAKLYNKKNAKIAASGLSLTDRSTTPIQIFIHEDNWYALPKKHGTEFTSLDQYRVAILNHEFAHALGHDHVSCPCKPGESCTRKMDVRQQPSRSLGGCLPHTEVVLHSDAKKSHVNF